MVRLTTTRRRRLRKSQYALPSKAKKGPRGGVPRGAYPVNDKQHAATAKAYAKREYQRGNLSAADYKKIVAKANRVLKAAGAKTINGKKIKRTITSRRTKK